MRQELRKILQHLGFGKSPKWSLLQSVLSCGQVDRECFPRGNGLMNMLICSRADIQGRRKHITRTVIYIMQVTLTLLKQKSQVKPVSSVTAWVSSSQRTTEALYRYIHAMAFWEKYRGTKANHQLLRIVKLSFSGYMTTRQLDSKIHSCLPWVKPYLLSVVMQRQGLQS